MTRRGIAPPTTTARKVTSDSSRRNSENRYTGIGHPRRGFRDVVLRGGNHEAGECEEEEGGYLPAADEDGAAGAGMVDQKALGQG